MKTPQTEQELLEKAYALAGYSISEIGQFLNIKIPEDLSKNKGFIGILIEKALGATAGNKAEQDFAELGIELKTIPINKKNEPTETTFVSIAPFVKNYGIIWETSHVKHKLSKVLFIPIEADKKIPLKDRRIGLPILWEPSPEEEQQLKADWEELMDHIILGNVEKINSKMGTFLQLRTKCSSSKDLTKAIGEDGNIVFVKPRGFYLKKEFTKRIINNFLQKMKNKIN